MRQHTHSVVTRASVQGAGRRGHRAGKPWAPARLTHVYCTLDGTPPVQAEALAHRPQPHRTELLLPRAAAAATLLAASLACLRAARVNLKAARVNEPTIHKQPPPQRTRPPSASALERARVVVVHMCMSPRVSPWQWQKTNNLMGGRVGGQVSSCAELAAGCAWFGSKYRQAGPQGHHGLLAASGA